MVAEREGLEMEQSSAAWRRYARHHNLLLVDVAETVIGGSVAPSALGRVASGRSLPDERGVVGGIL